MNNWDKKFLDAATLVASWSKDPSTKVGCVITDDDHNQLAGGFNGFPRGVADDHRLTDRETKLKLIVHAEANAVAAAARNGHSLKGSTAYVTLPPCTQCAALLIQAGVRRVVFLSGVKPSKWEADWVLAQGLLTEAGIEFEEVERPEPKRVYEHLLPSFLKAMDDIGRYGFEKYKEKSFQHKSLTGDRERDARVEPQSLADHSREHFSMYLNHVEHDYFHDDLHQLAAAAFNCMMEAYYAGLGAKK